LQGPNHRKLRIKGGADNPWCAKRGNAKCQEILGKDCHWSSSRKRRVHHRPQPSSGRCKESEAGDSLREKKTSSGGRGNADESHHHKTKKRNNEKKLFGNFKMRKKVVKREKIRHRWEPLRKGLAGNLEKGKGFRGKGGSSGKPETAVFDLKKKKGNLAASEEGGARDCQNYIYGFRSFSPRQRPKSHLGQNGLTKAKKKM